MWNEIVPLGRFVGGVLKTFIFSWSSSINKPESEFNDFSLSTTTILGTPKLNTIFLNGSLISAIDLESITVACAYFVSLSITVSVKCFSVVYV